MVQALKTAFPHTIPVLTGYFFMGAAMAILMVTSGIPAIWATIMAVAIYAGSGQFVMVGLLAAGFDPVATFLVILMVNARHIFYGLANLTRFRDFDRYRWYLIFSLTDETFALFSSVKVPPEIEERKFLTAIAVLDQLYWIAGCTVGAFAGTLITFDVTGIEFVMTALFVVILIQKLQEKDGRSPAFVGLAVAVICRLAFGSEAFIISTMIALVAVFALLRPRLDPVEAA
ncbi:MAG: AzlC family ABC transporter permease [Propionibacteriaceae bacterium]|jgi:4-azaleucine resistance transporter AzlC|nr:AzlC family ABC transporter permease [Propionibacteriaceae bacterium]